MTKTLTELWGEPGSGKSHLAHQWTNSVYHLDTAYTTLGFRSMEIDDDRERGETWPVVLKQYDWDETKASEHYEFLSAWPQNTDFIPVDVETVVIDNAADLRVLAAHDWCVEHNTDWPQRAQWGEVHDKVDRFLRALQRRYHVVVISQMTDEYEDGEKTGHRVRDGPKRLDHRADFRLRLEVDDGTRVIHIVKNRFLDQAGDDWVGEIQSSIDLETLAALSNIPEEQL